MTDLLLRKAQAVRARVQGDDDYDVVGSDGLVIGRILGPPHRLMGHRGCGRWLTGITRTERRRTGMSNTGGRYAGIR